MNEPEVDVALICKNCQHKISLHMPNCTTLLEDDNDNICNCNKPEFYNVAISGKYIGWTEIHCNNCGKLVAYIDSSIENIEDFKICVNTVLFIIIEDIPYPNRKNRRIQLNFFYPISKTNIHR